MIGSYERWGFLDEKGKWVIEPQFYKVDNFKNGIARIKEDYISFFGKKQEFETELIITSGYSRMCDYIYQLLDWKIFKYVEKIGYINKQGDYIWEPTE